MGRPRIDISGQRFGKLVALGPIDDINRKRLLWRCLCDCGTYSLCASGNLRGGRTSSCGCNGPYSTHELSQSREYGVWENMKSRCFNKKCRGYQYIGGRGLSMEVSWTDSFENFLKDMGLPPAEGFRLSRKDKTLPYCKDNCVWMSPDDVYPDITGQKFGRWTVVEKCDKSRTSGTNRRWLCVCECGKTGKVRSSSLTKGYSKSCGCSRPGNKSNLTHGQTGTAEYHVWVVAKSQINLSGPLGERRRAQGIAMCTEWTDSFETFLKDMGKKPHAKSRLTRRDKSRGFSKDNCYWSLSKSQSPKVGS